MHHDVVIIGAGMSGLAAGIRLAHFDRRVLIVEKHYAFGGLNSYYTLGKRAFDVGLHAVTNFADPKDRSAPLNKLLRQLRLRWEDFDLKPQRFTEVRFPGRRLRWTNDASSLLDSVAETFPKEADGFRRLVAFLRDYDDTRLDASERSARAALTEFLRDPSLIDMLLCPLMYYGSTTEHDMDVSHFATLFKSIFLEGFARPVEGVRRIIKTLVRRYRACGGKIRMRCGVRRIIVNDGRVQALELDDGDTITADVVLSSAGYHETMRLCSDRSWNPAPEEMGRISFVESILVLDRRPDELGHEATIVFFNDADRFTYAVPDDLIDARSGVVCCPTNYIGHETIPEGWFRVTLLADPLRWKALDEAAYRHAKERVLEEAIRRGEAYMPALRKHVVFSDTFTPRTIERYTGHLHGAVYGAPRKRRDGRTDIANLFLCGTDQGFLGIIGAMLSGITIANLHVLSEG